MTPDPAAPAEADPASAPALESVELPSPVKSSGKAGVWLNDSIEILSDSPLVDYNQGPIRAYAARLTSGVKGIALICEKALVPRAHVASTYASILNQGLVRLLGHGIVEWPIDATHRRVFVYEGGWGHPLIKHGAPLAMGLKGDVILASILKPLILAMQDLRNKDFPHGGIRPSNIFDGGSLNYQKIMIGDCLAAPFAHSQDPVFLTPDKMMAQPTGRGIGTAADDMYALGVTLAILLRAQDPHHDKGMDVLLREKLDLGSYAALLGKDRTTGTIHELLRGLLSDDVSVRWTIEEVFEWLDGKRLNLKQAAKRAKANRPIIFREEKYTSPYLLGLDLIKAVPDAIRLIQSNEVKQWLNRSVVDRIIEQRFDTLMQVDSEMLKTAEMHTQFVFRAAVTLNKDMPVVHKSLRVMPDGIGTALAESIAAGRDVRDFVDLLSSRQIMFWLDLHADGAVDVSSLIGKLDHCQAFLKQKALGYGIERCIYVLCPEAPCLSDKLRRYHVRNGEDLMHAYEDMAKSRSRPAGFLDRHIVAFLLTHDKQTIDAHIADINAPETHRNVIGTLHVLNNLQSRYKMPPFPKITEWVLDFIAPIFERVHDRDLRKHLREKAMKAASTGRFQSVISMFDNPQMLVEDFKGFRDSMAYYRDLSNEYDRLDQELQTNSRFGLEAGQQFSAILCGVIAFIVVVSVSMLNFGSL